MHRGGFVRFGLACGKLWVHTFLQYSPSAVQEVAVAVVAVC